MTGRDAVALLCGGEQGAKGQTKATRAARRRIARLAVTAGSYAETAGILREFLGMTPSRETVRRITNEAGRRTQEALFAGGLPLVPGPKWTPPEGARRVPLTMVIGSGMAEVGCKLTVGGRLKGPGMHWRFEHGVRVALLRGVIRSRRHFAA